MLTFCSSHYFSLFELMIPDTCHHWWIVISILTWHWPIFCPKIVIQDHHQPQNIAVKGIKAVKGIDENYNNRLLNESHWRLTHLQSLKRVIWVSLSNVAMFVTKLKALMRTWTNSPFHRYFWPPVKIQPQLISQIQSTAYGMYESTILYTDERINPKLVCEEKISWVLLIFSSVDIWSGTNTSP